jgi:membrane-associated phospholipid phosphatase
MCTKTNLPSLKKLLIVIFCITSIEANAQKTVTDTTRKNLPDTLKKDLLTAPDTVKKLHTNPWSLVPPAVLITYGTLSFWVQPIRNVDYYIKGQVEKNAPNFNTTAESYFMFAPIIAVYGLNLVGVEGKNRFIDRTALLGLSGAFMGVSTFTVKYLTHRQRPNGADYLSFPSSHTGFAFMAAEFMAQEYDAKSPWYGVAAYAIATTTGVFRIYNNDHWFSDVVAGAGFGILSTKAAYWIYPTIRNWLTHGDEKANGEYHSKKKQAKSTLLTPTYQYGAWGLSFATEF